MAWRLTQAMLEGKLAVRADASKHQGDYRKLIDGVNLTLDNVIRPLNVSAEYVDRISKGDIPPKITDTYNGDFNEIKNNLNVCIDAVSRLVADGVALTQAMLEGKLAMRADASKHQGDYRKTDRGRQPDAGRRHRTVECLGRVRGPHLQGRHPAEDHRHLQRRLQRDQEQPEQLHRQHSGAGGRDRLLVKASGEGKLATRADATKHQGDYRKIVEGVNEMLDAILLPIGEGNRILAQVSAGKIDELIAQTYNGDHEKMKQAINNVAGVLQGLQKELDRLTAASEKGNSRSAASRNSSRAPTRAS